MSGLGADNPPGGDGAIRPELEGLRPVHARRSRRLLPAAAGAFVGIVILSALFLPPLRLADSGAPLTLPSGHPTAAALGPASVPPSPFASILAAVSAIPSSLASTANPVEPPADSPVPSVAATPRPTARPTKPSSLALPVPPDMLPTLASARDRPIVYDDGCHLVATAIDIPECAFGDTASSTTVVLYGDSHAAQWFPALDRIAKAAHWRLVSLTKSGCTPVDVGLWYGSQDRRYTECDTWRERALLRIGQEHAALVLVASAHLYQFLDGETLVWISQKPDLWNAGLERTVASLSGVAGRVAYLGDTPASTVDVPDCVSAHLDDTRPCATPRSVAVNAVQSHREASILGAGGGSFVDPVPWVCPTDPCQVIIGRYLVYRDSNHLTALFAGSLWQRLLDALPPVAG